MIQDLEMFILEHPTLISIIIPFICNFFLMRYHYLKKNLNSSLAIIFLIGSLVPILNLAFFAAFIILILVELDFTNIINKIFFIKKQNHDTKSNSDKYLK